MGTMWDILDYMWRIDHGSDHGVILRAAIEIPMLWEEIRPVFHSNLKRLLSDKSMSRRQLSKMISSNEYYITKMIASDSAPGFDKILDISNALEVHYTALFETDLSRIANISNSDDDKAFDELIFSLKRYTNAIAWIDNKEIGPQEIVAKWREKRGETAKLVDIIEYLDIFEVTKEHPYLALDRIGEQSLASQVLNGPKHSEYERELEGPLVEKIRESLPRYQGVLDDDDIFFSKEVIKTRLLSGRTLVLKYECYLMPGRENGVPTRVLTFADPIEVSLVKSDEAQ